MKPRNRFSWELTNYLLLNQVLGKWLELDDEEAYFQF